jgi:hypothetical protein
MSPIPQPIVQIITLEKVIRRKPDGFPYALDKDAVTQTMQQGFNIVITPRTQVIVDNTTMGKHLSGREGVVQHSPEEELNFFQAPVNATARTKKQC